MPLTPLKRTVRRFFDEKKRDFAPCAGRCALRSGGCGQLVFLPGVWQQVRAGAAHGQRTVRSAAGTLVGRGRGLRGQLAAQPAGDWQSDGLPGQHVWCAAVRLGVLEGQKAGPDACGGGVRHGHHRRTAGLPDWHPIHERGCRQRSVYCVHHSLPHQHGGGRSAGEHADLRAQGGQSA